MPSHRSSRSRQPCHPVAAEPIGRPRRIKVALYVPVAADSKPSLACTPACIAESGSVESERLCRSGESVQKNPDARRRLSRWEDGMEHELSSDPAWTHMTWPARRWICAHDMKRQESETRTSHEQIAQREQWKNNNGKF